ncbi:Transcriptional regulatory protein OmpR [Marinomonas aquimarina]|uniref:Transcriptional regulatory protein OmpR n=1 Tax=Marinomonas aquimarina TaxID=295068 RepID=A0A1A8TAW0_9GAMM|nr:fused response regulator/phosphatase [Marinomonas aquimarina]SBS28685.1 Transcriptional regulatory protein OmpR [Marinomonas aquimarina]
MSSGSSVLILEDDISTRLIVSKSLSAQGIQTVTATTISEAENLIPEHDISLFLLDVHLPDGDSTALVRKLRVSHPLIPILVMTGDYEQNRVAEFFDLGVRDFINKPVHPILLASRVRSFIRNSITERALFDANEMYQRIAHEKEQEEELAHYVYDHILKVHTSKMDGLDTVIRSSGKFCGDMLLSAKAPNGNLIVLLADATGHGMAAALTIYPMVSTFAAMVAKGLSLGAILKELSAKHSQCIPQNRFVAAILLELSLVDNTIRVWNGGMPAVLMFDNEGNLSKVTSKHVAIGIMPDDMVSTKMEVFELDQVSKMALFSDGLIENKVMDGRTLAFNEVYDMIATNLDDPKGLLDTMHGYENFTDDLNDHDDMTLAVLDLHRLTEELKQVEEDNKPLPGSFSFDFELTGSALNNEKFAYNLIELLGTYGFHKDFCQKVFTVMTELFVNAVDHGIFNIPSKLKEDDFIAYLSMREERQATLSATDKVKITLAWDQASHQLTIILGDSGTGYATDKLKDLGDEVAYGRGLKLIASLCHSFTYDQITNTTHVTLEY